MNDDTPHPLHFSVPTFFGTCNRTEVCQGGIRNRDIDTAAGGGAVND